MLKQGDLVMLVCPQGKRYVRKLRDGETMQTHFGVLEHKALLQAGYGEEVRTHLGHPFRNVSGILSGVLSHAGAAPSNRIDDLFQDDPPLPPSHES